MNAENGRISNINMEKLIPYSEFLNTILGHTIASLNYKCNKRLVRLNPFLESQLLRDLFRYAIV